ncbi:MAG: hypothetical protein LBR68_07580 [Lachnoclostridium sp.]|jgi:hypothetical protein|nr:hypothetical protein [Lachnoclostridium sp.]
MRNRGIFTHLSGLPGKVIVILLIFTLMINYICGINANISYAAKRMKLRIKTTHYTIERPLEKSKKTQTIVLKNLSRKHKVIWKSSNKRLASVKKIRSSKNKAKCTVYLNKVKPLPVKKQSVKIKAIIRVKKTNKKVKTLTQSITFENVIPVIKTPTETPIVATPYPSPSPEQGDNLYTLPPNPSPGEIFVTLTPDPSTPPVSTTPPVSISPPTSTSPSVSISPPASSTPSISMPPIESELPSIPPSQPPSPSASVAPSKNPNDDGWTGWY